MEPGAPISMGFSGVFVGFGEIRQAHPGERKIELRLALGPVEEVGPRDIELDVKGTTVVGRIVHLEFGDFAAQAFELRHHLGQIFPARVRHLAKADAQRQLAIAAEGEAHMGGELAEIADLALGLDDLRIRYGRVGGRFHELGHSAGRDDQRFLPAQVVGEQAEGRDLRGGIQPDHFLADRHHADDVVELRGRGQVGINFAAGIDERGGGVNAQRVEQPFQQRVLVLAVAVLVGKDFSGGMRLIAANTERQADVAEILGDVVVDGLQLLHVGVAALHQFLGAGADFGRGRAAVAFQSGVPTAHRVPGGKGGHLHVRLLGLDAAAFFLISLAFVALLVRRRPAIDAPVTFVGDLGVVAGAGFQLDGAVARDIDLELVIENDAGVQEAVLHPEFVGSQRRVGGGDDLVFENFARTQTGNGDVLLVKVGVDGRFASDGRVEILNGRCRRGDHQAAGLEHANIRDLDGFVGGAVAEDELSERLDAGFGLHPDAGGDFFAPGAVVFEAIHGALGLDDVGLLRVIRLLGSARGRGKFLGDGGGREKEEDGDELHGNRSVVSQIVASGQWPVPGEKR